MVLHLNQNKNKKYNKYSGTRLIRHRKGPGKCVGLYKMSKHSDFTLVNRNTLGL